MNRIKIKKRLLTFVEYAILIFCSLLVIIPLLWMVSTALKTEPETIQIPPNWIPKKPTIESFKRLWSEYPFLIYFKNSAIIVFGSMILSTIAASFAGYGVTRFNFKGKHAFLTF